VTLVFTDIAKAASLWSACPNAMRDATLLHNETLRSLLAKHRGYEAVFLQEKIVGEGSFCMAFSTVVDALSWCSDVQRKLIHADWPEELLAQDDVAEEIGGVDDRIIFRGLRVRMGVHVGVPKLRRDPMSQRVEYLGPPVMAAARVTVLAQGGQVLLTRAAFDRLRNTDLVKERRRFARLGATELGDEPGKTEIFEMRVRGLESRYYGDFGAAAHADGGSSGDDSNKRRSDCDSASGFANDDGIDISDRTVDLDQLASSLGEQTFLTGANMVRWVIKYEDIQIADQIGIGSYGVVFKGTWKGIDVAVKRFIKQRLDERHLLEFRAEVACLSEMRHPNIVLFIGACLRMPNLCIVTEWVKQGSLKALLATTSIKLPWQMRLRMLRDAARGVHYLHTLEPCIVHRDLKPSNLLVDESWNVKVADFGFARIKEENITMTRCGTPAWTAPEVIRGERYSELADVYSFGIIMWEMATRKQPYAGRNFMGVTLDVLEGKRPQVPADCPAAYRAMMTQCWKGKPKKRPSMEEVLHFFDSALSDLTMDEIA
jgi:class 3 adenylate cyclase/tRNA A-37 threonylcarbamoyl transferase component Bud32